MAFSFYGNKQAISVLSKTISSGKLSHAYLFYGDEGVGKKTLARQFAQGILCENKDKPCMICQSCRKISSMNHPDYVEIGDDMSNGKQSFTVDQVRKLIEDAYIRPNEGTHKIFLIKNIESLLASSANTLLKLLEEPPYNVVFLLTCENKQGVLKTITSRCILVGVYPVTCKDCMNALSECIIQADKQELEIAVQLSEGNIGKAMFYTDDPVGKKVVEISSLIETAFFEKNELSFMQSVAELEKDVSLSLAVFKCFLSRLRISLTNKANQSNLDIEFSKKILKATECVEKTKDVLLKNGNKRLAIANFCSKMFT